MTQEATVRCEVCGEQAVVNASAILLPQALREQLPIGWTVETRVVHTTGKTNITVYCPNHKPAV
jgi:hypothetical protein